MSGFDATAGAAVTLDADRSRAGALRSFLKNCRVPHFIADSDGSCGCSGAGAAGGRWTWTRSGFNLTNASLKLIIIILRRINKLVAANATHLLTHTECNHAQTVTNKIYVAPYIGIIASTVIAMKVRR